MLSRPRAVVTAFAVAASLALAGCAPTPAPSSTHKASATTTPRPTTADEAFAAAERTYRAYVDALNHVDLSDPKTFDAVYAWTTGEALEGEKKSLTNMHAKGWSLSGKGEVVSAKAVEAAPAGPVIIAACYDVHAIAIVDDSGRSVVSPQRPQVQSIEAQFTAGPTRTGYQISRLAGGSEEC